MMDAIEIQDDPRMGRVIVFREPVTFFMDGRYYHMPAGYSSDGMSAPRWLWWLISPVEDRRTRKPAGKHDWLYDEKPVSRSAADRYFRDDLIRNGFPLVLSWIIWICVRLFGWSHWI